MKTKKILLLLAKGFEAYEASVFTDVLGWNRLEGDGTTEVVACGLHQALRCTWNFTVIPEMLLSEADPASFDALAIPGGFEEAGFYEDAYSDEFMRLIQAFDRAGKPIAAVCVGALAVGKSGVLRGRRGTTYHLKNGLRRAQLAGFGVQVVDELLVRDGNIITSSCPATALDVAFTLLEMLTSAENRRAVQERMGF